MKEQELNQEPLRAAEPKTAVEAPINPKNPLNVNVDANENEKENVSVYEDVKDNSNEKEKDYVDVKDDGNEGNGFVDSLILNDFDDEEEYSSIGNGSMSNYIEGKPLEEQERLYRQSQPLEEDTFVQLPPAEPLISMWLRHIALTGFSFNVLLFWKVLVLIHTVSIEAGWFGLRQTSISQYGFAILPLRVLSQCYCSFGKRERLIRVGGIVAGHSAATTLQHPSV